VRVLGELELVRDGSRVALPASKKTRSLLGYLAVTDRAHLRSHLCDLLWDGPDDPRAALRWSLAKLRPLVNDARIERLTADREHARFDPAGARIDLHAARAALSAGALAATPTDTLEAVASAFRGELLEGLDLPSCYRFHEWCVAERQAVRALRISLLESLVSRTRSEPERALTFARARVAIDPLSEHAHVAVIEILGELGRTREGLEQVESCKRILADELHARPSIALERARIALTARPPERRGAQPSAPAPTNPTAATSRESTLVAREPEPVLVARDRERGLIAETIAAARTKNPTRPLLFLGEPGIGKSRLLGEVAAQARAAGGQAIAGRAFEAEMVRPYGAWIDALTAVRFSTIAEEVLRDAAPLVGSEASSAAGADKSRLFDAVIRLVEGLAAGAPPLVVILDDIHWIDEASAALLHFIVRANVPGLVVACGARSAELFDNRHALRLVRALGREKRLFEVALSPLDRDGIEALARAVVPGVDLGPVLADSQGNPLFVIEIARALARGDASSERLDELLDERLARLEGRAGDVVSWAAALGTSFDADVLGRVTGLASVDLLAAIEELERRGVVLASAAAASYDFVHDLVRVAAYRRLSEPRRRLVHLHIARALGTSDDALAGDVAHHAAVGGDVDLAVRACIAAGKRCVRLFANGAALELARRGLELASTLPTRARIEGSAELYGVAVTARDQDLPELEKGISRLFVDALTAGLHDSAQLAMHYLTHVRYRSEDWAKAAEDSLRLVEATEHADPASTVHALINGGACLALLGREIPKARAMLERATALAASHGVAMAVVQKRMGVGVAHHFLGELDEAVVELCETVARARTEADHWRASVCLSHLAMIALERGECDLAVGRAGELAAIAEKLGDGSEGPFAKAVDAIARRRSGEPGAAELVGSALEGLRAIDSKGHLAYALTHAADIDLAEGNHELAAHRAEEALAAAAVVARPSDAAVARALLGRAAFAAGRRDDATESLRALLVDLGRPGVLSARAHAAASALARDLGISLTDTSSTSLHS